jgi:PST family polysaccharide transporter
MIKTLKNIINNQFYAISLYTRSITGTLILFVIARYLTVYDFGLFSSYKNIAGFWFMFANLGFAEYILVSSKANPKETRLKIAMFLSNAFLIAILICMSGTFCVESKLLFSLVVIRTFFDNVFFALILPYFQATKQFNTIGMINILYSICIIIIACIAYIFRLSLINFLIINIIVGLINFIQCSIYAKIDYFLFINNIKNYVIKMTDKSILAYMGVTLAYFMYSQIPSLYVSTFIPKEQVALYFAAFTIASIVNLLISAQTQKMVPEIIRAKIEEVDTIIKSNLKFVLTFISCVLILIACTGKLLLLLLYGQEYYKNAYYVLLILMLGNIGIGQAAVFGTYITASGNQRMKIPMQLNATLLTILGLLLLHKYQIYGAAISYLVSGIYIAIRYTLKTKELLKQ